MIKHIKDVVQGKADTSDKRSSKWDTVRKNFLKTNSTCAVCGGKDKLEVHHKQPFHEHPELELDPTNLITLCESKSNGVTCHLLFGHLGNYRSINKDVDKDVQIWNDKIKNRPKD
jgi:5-methylcytosine-specific restriction endonuclease McrA